MQSLICALIAFLVGCQVTSWKYEADIKTDAANRAEATARNDEKYREIQSDLQSEIARLNDELETKQAGLTNERRGVSTGDRVVYVAAKCPTPGRSEKPGTDTPSGNTSRPGRLEPVAEQNYLDYKRKYQDQLNTFKKCVAFARSTVEHADP